jgi:hypothetical protein
MQARSYVPQADTIGIVGRVQALLSGRAKLLLSPLVAGLVRHVLIEPSIGAKTFGYRVSHGMPSACLFSISQSFSTRLDVPQIWTEFSPA